MLETVVQVELSTRQRPRDLRSGEVAAALNALAFADSDGAATEAYHRFLFAVGNDHRGSYFPIVLDTVPYLGEILAAGTPRVRARTLDVLIDLVGSFGPDPEIEAQGELRPDDLPMLLRASIKQLRPIIEDLAADATAPDGRALAQELLGYLDDQRCIPLRNEPRTS